MGIHIGPRKPVTKVGNLIREFVVTTKRTYHTGDTVIHVEYKKVTIAAVEKSHAAIRNIAHGLVPINVEGKANAVWVNPNDFVIHKK
jgi:hypothetical protein